MDSEDKTSQWQPFRSYLSRRDLDKALALLKHYYCFISIDDALEKLEGHSPIDRHYCVVTFDDGLKNNLTHAMPILRRHQIPAVMYLVTQQIDRQEPFWFDRLDYAIQNAAQLVDSVDVFGEKIKIQHGNTAEMKNTFLAIKEAAYESNHSYNQVIGEIQRVILELERHSGKSLCDIYAEDPWSKVMSWQDVENSATASDITFGSHTVDHSLLGKISEEEVEYQLKHSKEAVEKHASKPCLHFCYPNGDTPQKADEHMSEAGFKSAVSTEAGANRKDNFERFNLKRYNIPPDLNPIRSLAIISGLRNLI
jgi:peptidoglycan/xylan/chitin deacetylase (PgdA/CDA1 family)